MLFKFYNHTMELHEFIELNWNDLPEQIRACAERSDSVPDLQKRVYDLISIEQSLQWELDVARSDLNLVTDLLHDICDVLKADTNTASNLASMIESKLETIDRRY